MFSRGAAEIKTQEARSEEIGKLKTGLDKMNLEVQVLKDALRENYVIICRKLMLNIHRCMLSLRYQYILHDFSSFQVSPYKPPSEYEDFVISMQENKFKAADGVISAQDFPSLKISTSDDDENIFPTNWKSILEKEKKIPFRILPSFPTTSNKCNIRITDLRSVLFPCNPVLTTNAPQRKVPCQKR